MVRYLALLNLVVILSIVNTVSSQERFRTKDFVIAKSSTSDPKSIPVDFHAEIRHIEAPTPDGDSYRSFLMRQKIAAREKFESNRKSTGLTLPKSETTPIIGTEFIPTRYTANGNPFTIMGGIPSDNTLAISDSGIVLVGMNSMLYAHDLIQDTSLFPNYSINLRALANGSMSSMYYDPKLYYDPSADRFIAAFLKDFSPSNSEIIITFSSSNDPNDPWYVYNLPGNPLNNNRWTDFPAIAVTEDKLYFTANLIIPDVSWQVGFDGSIIWEMDKHAGFEGENINATLYHDITYDNRFIRNLHPVQGADGIADELVLLSNRNFDLENDTIFFLRLIDGNIDVQALRTDVPYGVPPNARQEDTDISDPTEGLQTNDARVLGAIKFNDQIQFVANTMNPETGFSAVYHGIIDLTDQTPSVRGNILGDDVKDYAYPNIAWSGNEDCDRETILVFLYSSFDDFPGVATTHFTNNETYSPVKIIQGGLNYVNRLPGGYERWGDYTGLQRQYNKKGTVHSFGYYPTSNKSNTGYYAQLFSPDTTSLHVQFTPQQPIQNCNNTILIEPQNGSEPITIIYTVSNGTNGTGNSVTNICTGDTIWASISDAKGCYHEQSFVLPKVILEEGINVYPNPSYGSAIVQFNLSEDALIRFELYDINGRLVKKLVEQKANAGINEFTFSLDPLSAGLYNLVLFQNNSKTDSFKIIKAE